MSNATIDISPAIQPLAQLQSSGRASVALFLTIAVASIYIIRQWALPKPLPGLPYRAKGASSILGDFLAIGKYLASSEATYFDWLIGQSKDLNSPVYQIFPRPLGKPTVVLNDFRESQDILMRRGKEFDRSFVAQEIFQGITPQHHIVQKTNAVWKSQRRLLQDLMSPGFIDGIAAPVVYHHVSNLVRLWNMKLQIAQGRPFTAASDIYSTALDAVHGFAYGQGFKHSAIKPELEYVEHLNQEATVRLTSKGGRDDPVKFPAQDSDEVIQAVCAVTATFAEVQGSPIANLKWPFLNRSSKLVNARKIRDEAIRKEIQAAVERTKANQDPAAARSALDHMVRRETILAEKEGRAEDFYAKRIYDELFGFVVAGHDTTSTTISWGVKFLADNPEAQTRLRSALQEGFSAAKEEKRAPTVQEITSSRIPYLEAVEEEILRCAPTIQTVDREAMVDTVVLGHKIPKGTLVVMPSGGASPVLSVFEIDEAKRHASSREAKKSGKSRSEWDPTDVAVFKPERWLTNDGDEFDSASGPQLAFSLGTRSCFGKRLAYAQLRILITLIVWNFELLKCPDELSGYGHKGVLTTEPTQCFLKLNKVQL